MTLEGFMQNIRIMKEDYSDVSFQKKKKKAQYKEQ